MKVITVVGARPQFVKAAPVSQALRAQGVDEKLIHTGQHYDYNMSALFFDELDIPEPAWNLGVGSGSHGAQTAAMLTGIEQVLLTEKPDWVLVYGDTNSTLAGALAATKLHVKVAHVEAGLRSFNRRMPEEINRVVTDHVSDLLLCPSQTAVDNLAKEGITHGVHLVGDVMADALAFATERARHRSDILVQLGLAEKGFLLATVHRAENTDDETRLRNIWQAFTEIGETIVFPVHPRTRNQLAACRLPPAANVRMIEPVGYLDMVMLEQSAKMILTDSGGIQKEAYWLGVPCVTLRDETEWVETVQAGWNVLVGADPVKIITAAREFVASESRPMLYGDSRMAERITRVLREEAL